MEELQLAHTTATRTYWVIVVVALVYVFFFWLDGPYKYQISDDTFYRVIGIAIFVVITIGLLLGALPAILVGKQRKQ